MKEVGNEARLRDPLTPGAPIIPRGEWDYPPYHRWTFQHIREMTATAQVWRGPGPVLSLPTAPRDIDQLVFEAGGRRRTIRDFLDESFTDGFLVLSRGAIVAEHVDLALPPAARRQLGGDDLLIVENHEHQRDRSAAFVADADPALAAPDQAALHVGAHVFLGLRGTRGGQHERADLAYPQNRTYSEHRDSGDHPCSICLARHRCAPVACRAADPS